MQKALMVIAQIEMFRFLAKLISYVNFIDQYFCANENNIYSLLLKGKGFNSGAFLNPGPLCDSVVDSISFSVFTTQVTEARREIDLPGR